MKNNISDKLMSLFEEYYNVITFKTAEEASKTYTRLKSMISS